MRILTQCLVCIFGGILMIGALGGCANDPKNIDPWEKTNRFFYSFNDNLDHYALKPLADGYVKIIPKPVRTCIGNGYDNLQYGDVILNDFLQGQWQQGWSDAGRMGVNTTVGIAGIFDVATRWNLPSHDNDFGMTLGKWGADAGPYLVLPLFGPSCVRDAPDIGVGILTNPVTWIDPPWYVTIPLFALQAVDSRSRLDREVRFRDQAAIDPYAFTRHAYLEYRRAKISGSEAPANQDMYEDESGPTTAPATQPSTQPATAPATQTQPVAPRSPTTSNNK